ncbi:hypothetical protein MMC20_002529 [Loxospora ochrophaea]|nr:hypothetical protein [Loxospora ochrophaea]
MSVNNSLEIFHFITLDVFTAERWSGNPLGVVEVPAKALLTQGQKQNIAREFNYSEVVFLHEHEGHDGQIERRVDIFTTTEELPFAGHPTIGTLCYIGLKHFVGTEPEQSITLQTKAGAVTSLYDPKSRLAEAEIPHNVHLHRSRAAFEHILETQPQLLNSMRAWDLRPRLRMQSENESVSYPIVSIVKGMTFILVNLPQVLGYLEDLQVGLPSSLSQVITLDEGWRGSGFLGTYYYVILSTESNGLTKIRSRMIEPGIGEDPATGSAACTLGVYLALQARKPGATCMYDIEQGVEMGRRSQIRVQVTLDDSGRQVKQVKLSGTAVLVAEGTFQI